MVSVAMLFARLIMAVAAAHVQPNPPDRAQSSRNVVQTALNATRTHYSNDMSGGTWNSGSSRLQDAPTIRSDMLLAPKDIATIALSLAALLTSVTVATFNWRVYREKRRDDTRSVFDNAMTGIQESRDRIEELRHELAERFDDPALIARRIVLSDKRHFHLARALSSSKYIQTTSIDNLLLAAALADTGRIGTSVPYYEQSVLQAADDFERLICQRVLGLARLRSGTREQGRAEMLQAANGFRALAQSSSYDFARMLDEEAETLRRLVSGSLTIGYSEYIVGDMDLMEKQGESASPTTKAAIRQLADLVKSWLPPNGGLPSQAHVKLQPQATPGSPAP